MISVLIPLALLSDLTLAISAFKCGDALLRLKIAVQNLNKDLTSYF